MHESYLCYIFYDKKNRVRIKSGLCMEIKQSLRVTGWKIKING